MVNVDSNTSNSNLPNNPEIDLRHLKLVYVPKNKPKFRSSAIIATLVATLAASGCSSLPADAPITAVDYRACLVLEDDENRPGLNETSTYAVNQAVVTYGVKKTISTSTPQKLATAVKKLVKSECRLIIVVGSAFTTSLAPAVASNPETNFLLITDAKFDTFTGTDIQNLAVHRIDLYEAGLLAGNLAASLSEANEISAVCANTMNENYLQGLRAGAAEFDLSAETSTTISTEFILQSGSDVLLPFGCLDELPTDTIGFRIPFIIIGFGRDLYLNKNLAESVRSRIHSTLIPQIGAKILEVIASDLENDFIGGLVGSTVGTFGTGGIALGDEHEIPWDTTQERLAGLASKYEVSLN